MSATVVVSNQQAAVPQERPVVLISRVRIVSLLFAVLNVLSLIFGGPSPFNIVGLVVCILAFRAATERKASTKIMKLFSFCSCCAAGCAAVAALAVAIAGGLAVSCACSTECTAASWAVVVENQSHWNSTLIRATDDFESDDYVAASSSGSASPSASATPGPAAGTPRFASTDAEGAIPSSQLRFLFRRFSSAPIAPRFMLAALLNAATPLPPPPFGWESEETDESPFRSFLAPPPPPMVFLRSPSSGAMTTMLVSRSRSHPCLRGQTMVAPPPPPSPAWSSDAQEEDGGFAAYDDNDNNNNNNNFVQTDAVPSANAPASGSPISEFIDRFSSLLGRPTVSSAPNYDPTDPNVQPMEGNPEPRPMFPPADPSFELLQEAPATPNFRPDVAYAPAVAAAPFPPLPRPWTMGGGGRLVRMRSLLSVPDAPHRHAAAAIRAMRSDAPPSGPQHKYPARTDDHRDDDEEEDEEDGHLHPPSAGSAILISISGAEHRVLTQREFIAAADRVCAMGGTVTAALVIVLLAFAALHGSASRAAAHLAKHPWYVQASLLRRAGRGYYPPFPQQQALPPAASFPALPPGGSGGDPTQLAQAPQPQPDANALYQFVPGRGFVAVSAPLAASVPSSSASSSSSSTGFSGLLRSASDALSSFAQQLQRRQDSSYQLVPMTAELAPMQQQAQGQQQQLGQGPVLSTAIMPPPPPAGSPLAYAVPSHAYPPMGAYPPHQAPSTGSMYPSSSSYSSSASQQQQQGQGQGQVGGMHPGAGGPPLSPYLTYADPPRGGY